MGGTEAYSIPIHYVGVIYRTAVFHVPSVSDTGLKYIWN